jgi:ketosteroid isomerase-like protein
VKPAKNPEDVPGAFAERFNRQSIDDVMEIYADGAVLMNESGEIVTGDPVRDAYTEVLALGLPTHTTVRHALVSGDTALLIADWEMHGTAADGSQVDMSGTATDVVRRGADGNWRYVIDYPFGGKGPDAGP